MPARSAVSRAHSEARSHGNDYIGTEHLLLGVLDGGEDDAVGETLRSFTLTGEAIRSRVEDMIGPVGEPQPGHLPFSPRAKSALERSRYEAEVPGHGLVERTHILAALMLDVGGPVDGGEGGRQPGCATHSRPRACTELRAEHRQVGGRPRERGDEQEHDAAELHGPQSGKPYVVAVRYVRR
jgi:ATP-dependent Clp protease ATP-binding subunit ClpA